MSFVFRATYEILGFYFTVVFFIKDLVAFCIASGAELSLASVSNCSNFLVTVCPSSLHFLLDFLAWSFLITFVLVCHSYCSVFFCLSNAGFCVLPQVNIKMSFVFRAIYEIFESCFSVVFLMIWWLSVLQVARSSA